MRKLVAAALSTIAILALSSSAVFANDCYLVNKPVGAGVHADGQGVFYTFDGLDFFNPPASAQGLPDTDFGKALPEGARSSGPGDGCGYGIDSYETCVLGE